MMIRIYALYNRGRPILTLLIVLWHTTVIFNGWALVSYTSAISTPSTPSIQPNLTGPVTCESSLHSTSEQALYIGIAWGGQLVFDVIVFALTLWKTLRSQRSQVGSLMDVFLRDGSMYFGVMSAANIWNILMNTIATDSLRGVTAGLTNILSGILICRLMLNLRDYNSSTTPGISSSQLLSHGDRTLVFAHGLGHRESVGIIPVPYQSRAP